MCNKIKQYAHALTQKKLKLQCLCVQSRSYKSGIIKQKLINFNQMS